MDFCDRNYHLASTALSNGLPSHSITDLCWFCLGAGCWVRTTTTLHPISFHYDSPSCSPETCWEEANSPAVPHHRDTTQEAQEPLHWECLWENPIPRKVSTHCLTASDQAPSQKRITRGWEVEMKVSLMTLFPCDSSRVPRLSRPSQSAAIICRVTGMDWQRKTFRSALKNQKAHQCWSGMETTGAQWLPFVHKSILSY